MESRGEEQAEEDDSWLTGKAAPRGLADAPPGDAGEHGSSWWTPSMPDLPTDPAQLGSMLWGAALRVKATVTESIDGNLHELQAEQEAMLAEARRLQPLVGAEAGDARPPWRVLSEQYQILEEDLRSQMLELSKSQSTFLEGPAASGAPSPGGTAARLDYRRMLPTCVAALREDGALRQRRFELVPARLDEATFWRNYFERVSEIKDAILATSVHLNSVRHDGRGGAQPAREGGAFGAPPRGGGGAGDASALPSAALARLESDERADEMSERIRRELELDAELRLPLPPQAAAPSQPSSAGAGDSGRGAAPALPAAAEAAAPPQPAGTDAASAQPAASLAEPAAPPGAIGERPAGGEADGAGGEEDGEEDAGVELDSDDDIDKLLALGEEEAQAEPPEVAL